MGMVRDCVEVVRKRRRAKSVVGVTQEERSAGIREVALCACILDNGILVFYCGILFLSGILFSLLFYGISMFLITGLYTRCPDCGSHSIPHPNGHSGV